MNDFLQKLDLKNIFEGFLGNGLWYVFFVVMTALVSGGIWLIVRVRRRVYVKSIHGWQLFQQGPTKAEGRTVVTGWLPNSVFFEFAVVIKNQSGMDAHLRDAHVVFRNGRATVNSCEVWLSVGEIRAG